MRGVNKVILVGNLGGDPELHSGKKMDIATFSLATNEPYKDKDGDWQDKVEWHRCKVFGDNFAEHVADHFSKGDSVYVEGKISTSSWEDDNGDTRYATDIIVDKIILLSDKDKDEEDSRDRRRNSSSKKPSSSSRDRGSRNRDRDEDEDDDRSNRRKPASKKPAPAKKPRSRDEDNDNEEDDDLPF